MSWLFFSDFMGLRTLSNKCYCRELSVNNWDTFNQNNKDHIEAEIRVSMGLRQAVTTTLNRINGEMATQRWVTDFALRQHIHSFELAVNELKWQLDKTKEKLEDIEEEIKQLQNDIAAKSAPLKLVHSRLEARTDRPNMELCRDQVHEALLLEKEQLRSTISNLSSQLSRAL
uniref:Tektin n=1 Tax=Eptatretus burgeri TaxID=7764 RepID=A0A8C4RBR4_EPTBU